MFGCQDTTQLIEKDLDKLPEDPLITLDNSVSIKKDINESPENNSEVETSKTLPPNDTVVEKTNNSLRKCQDEFTKEYSIKGIFMDEELINCFHNKLKNE